MSHLVNNFSVAHWIIETCMLCKWQKPHINALTHKIKTIILLRVCTWNSFPSPDRIVILMEHGIPYRTAEITDIIKDLKATEMEANNTISLSSPGESIKKGDGSRSGKWMKNEYCKLNQAVTSITAAVSDMVSYWGKPTKDLECDTQLLT